MLKNDVGIVGATELSRGLCVLQNEVGNYGCYRMKWGIVGATE